MSDLVTATDVEVARRRTLEQTPEILGWDRKVMPTGWFQVAWSFEIKPGDVRPLRYFKKDFVLYRTEDGRAIIQSAFCPHMGAHLGHGGHVDGDRIVCPYHGWEWGCDGVNKLVPSDGAPTKSGRVLKNYHVAETNGIIWMWHDIHDREPLWPVLREYRNEGNFLEVQPATVKLHPKLRLQPQWIAENTVDVDHLIFVHKSEVIPKLASERGEIEYIVDGHIWYNNRPHPIQSSLTEGVGIHVIIIPQDPDQPRRLPSFLIGAVTPIDDEYSDFFHTNLVPQDTEVEGGDGPVPVGRAARRVKTLVEQGVRDLPIWENMVYINRPAYARCEAVMARFRKHCDQFYPDPDLGKGA